MQRERDEAVAAAALRETELRAAEEEAKKQVRENAKKIRAAFGKSCRTAGMDAVHTDYLRASLTPEQLQPMVDAFAADEQSAEAKAIFATHLAALLAVEQAAADARAQVVAAAAAAKELRDLEANWSQEEHAMLAKAVAKHPHGTPLRWHKVRSAANNHTGRCECRNRSTHHAARPSAHRTVCCLIVSVARAGDRAGEHDLGPPARAR